MRRIFTSTIFVAALAAISFNSFGQTCTQSTADFNTGTSTQNFTGAQISGTGSFSALAVNNSQLRSTVDANSANTYAITSATYSVPAVATNINFAFTYGSGVQATITGVQYALRYFSNTANAVVQTSPQTYINSNCTSIAKPSDFSGNSYQIVAIYTVTSGNGNPSNGFISYDNFGTSGTLAAAALPVKFQALDAKVINNSVSLNWNVATEENVSGYEIEKSADGSTYSKIGFVGAIGQSSYTFVDSKPVAVSYYRIKSVDINGRYGYSTVALVKAGSSMIVLKAFPSPFVKTLTVQHTSASGGSLISISSEDGRIIKSVVPVAGTQQTNVDLSAAKPGMYLIRFTDGNGGSETLKILKQQ